MSDAPERIWADSYSDPWGNELRWWSTVREDDAIEYRRADLPPTLAQAMMVPEVRELVQALKAWKNAGDDTGYYKAVQLRNAALHRIKGETE